MRVGDRIVLLLVAGIGAFALCFVDAARLRGAASQGEAERARLVAQLRLTDLALFTEARYTRHPSQADLQSAFQDHPLAFEHFPSGSLIAPPAGLLVKRHDATPGIGAGESAPGDARGEK